MPTPIHTPNGPAPLRRTNTADMRHTARQRVETRTRLPNEENVSLAGWGPPVCCRLKSIGSTLAQIAAAQGIEAQWSLKVRGDTAIPAGSIWQVTDGCWTETVRVTGDLVKHGAVMRRVGAVDTQLNKA